MLLLQLVVQSNTAVLINCHCLLICYFWKNGIVYLMLGKGIYKVSPHSHINSLKYCRVQLLYSSSIANDAKSSIRSLVNSAYLLANDVR